MKTISLSELYATEFIPPDFKLLNELQKLIEKHFLVNHSHDFYAAKLHVTVYRLNSLTKYYLKKTVYELIQHRIHEHARHLLKTTTLSSKQISFELGVCDPSYFCKCFKKMEGIKPRAFRQHHLKSLASN